MFRIGEEVFGRDGKLGELSRVVVDPGTHDVTYVVIRHGMLRTSERLLPVAVLESQDGEAYADITGDDFEQLQLFDLSHYRAPDPDYTGPPGFDATAAGGANTQLDAYVALGPLTTMGAAARVMGFPGGEASTISRDAPLPPAVAEGDDVLDCDGEKLGEIETLELDEDGHPVRLVVRRGFLFSTETDVPPALIGSVRDGAVTLLESKASFQDRTA
ncbi:MAG: PRC-barrel domain-containing protein [Dehalococcoidia bacterium]|nr:PRC-barrel domain-containing protein [Dehalococcoidia bacterium]